jgi:hypothetical protein
LAGVLQAIGGAEQNTPHVRHIGFHAAEPLKFAFRLERDDLRERSFSCAGRPVKDQRLNPIGFNGAAQQHARRKDVPLSEILVEVAGAHARGEWLMGWCLWWLFGFLKFRRRRSCGKQVFLRHAGSVNRKS